MGWTDRFFAWDGGRAQTVVAPPPPPPAPRPQVTGGVQAYSTIDLARDTQFPDFIRGGWNSSGAVINRHRVMRNSAVKRCVNLIENAIGMLPFPLLRLGSDGSRDKASDHPVFQLLTSRPNSRHTAFEFRRLMQRWLLLDGNAYALIVSSRGRVTSLIPLPPHRVQVRERADWTLEYKVSSPGGGQREVPPAEILHLRGSMDDGTRGCSLIDEAAEVLGLSMRADEAAARLFQNGTLAGTVLESTKQLTEQALENIRASLDQGHTGAQNAHRTLILEDGLTFKEVPTSGRDLQGIESRKHQVEEVARIFGVPRPMLMLDDTSWGSGIEQLGIFFVQYALAPWFACWEQAVSRALLTDAERRAGYYPKFNERALLRGSMKDQAEFLSKLSGAGGAPQLIEQNEARAWLDLPDHADGTGLSPGTQGGQTNGATGQD
jgi:HK97 family phage portal protein